MLGSAVATLKASVDAVLLMSKLEAGAESAEKEPFNLWYFLHQISALVRPQSISKGIAWSLQVDPTLPATVVGDQNHLGHILGNLLNNAFKFTSKGSVTLRASPVATGHVRFEVIDTGIGISSEDQERLFERFVQVDASPHSKHGGTGLGTSIARDLAELMGGRIGVISTPGQGSTFWVELPLVESVATEIVRDWAPWREVVVLGSSEMRQAPTIGAIRALGLEPVFAGKDLHDPRIFDSRRFLAAIWLMDVRQEAMDAEIALKDRTGVACPWVVLATDPTRSQRASLVERGAAAILDSGASAEEIARVLYALKNSLQAGAARLGQALPASASGNGFKPLQILLADDNKSNAYLMSRILQDAGHAVQTADSGSMAFDMLAGDAFDLAILDLNMPEMSGPDVTKLFRAASIGVSKLPIIIMSADATPAAKRESLDAGADEFLTKPISAATLVGTIERIMVGTQPTTDSAPEADAGGERNAANAPAQLLIDPERLQSLRRIARGDANFLNQYISAAFAELEAAIADLRKAIESSNVRAARDNLHIIEGTGGSIGAVALVSNCRGMRDSLQMGSVGDHSPALAEMSTTYALTKSTIVSGLRNRIFLEDAGQMMRERPPK
jgi:two-component system sensor histidine kinase RpfC